MIKLLKHIFINKLKYNLYNKIKMKEFLRMQNLGTLEMKMKLVKVTVNPIYRFARLQNETKWKIFAFSAGGILILYLAYCKTIPSHAVCLLV